MAQNERYMLRFYILLRLTAVVVSLISGHALQECSFGQNKNILIFYNMNMGLNWSFVRPSICVCFVFTTRHNTVQTISSYSDQIRAGNGRCHHYSKLISDFHTIPHRVQTKSRTQALTKSLDSLDPRVCDISRQFTDTTFTFLRYQTNWLRACASKLVAQACARVNMWTKVSLSPFPSQKLDLSPLPPSGTFSLCKTIFTFYRLFKDSLCNFSLQRAANRGLLCWHW